MMAEKRLGTLITLIAGIAWGLSGVSGQYLMSRGVSVDMITSLGILSRWPGICYSERTAVDGVEK